MKIVLFGNATEQIAAIRYRLVKFARMMEDEGHDCVICLPSSVALWRKLYEDQTRLSKLVYLAAVWLRRVLQLRHVPGADVVFFRGPVFGYGPTHFEYLIHRLNPRMVFDIDDAVWERPAYVGSPFVRLQDFDWLWKMCGLCVHGIVGNRYLQDRLEPRGIDTTIIPTCVDMDIHTAKTYVERPAARPVILGWTGLADNLGYFRVIEGPLLALAARHNLRLHVASGRPYRLAGLRVENFPWTLAREIEFLKTPDIGLMPLEPSPRAEGKCAFKALQFMAVGTPCVVSPVGMNKDIIEDGVTGFLAATPEEWEAKLERLIVDAALRQRMGEAARAFVQAHFSHEVHFPAWRDAVAKAAGNRA